MTLIFILFLAAFLRLVNINESFWLDEATSGLVVRNFDLSGILHQFLANDFHPPLYYFALKIWSEAFGYSESTLRSLSLLFALFTICLVYKLGNELFKNKSTAFLAALFLAVNPLHVYYSTEARMYSMLSFMVILAFWFFSKLIYTKKQSLFLWLGYGISLLLVVMTDYVGSFIVPVFWLLSYLRKKDQGFWFRFILAHLPLALVLVLYWPILGGQFAHGLGVKTQTSAWWAILGQPSLKNIFLLPTKFMLGRINYENKFVYAFWVALSALLWAIPIMLAINKDKKAKIFVFWLLIPIIIALAVGLFIPVVSYFRLLFVLPALVLLLAAGVQKLPTDFFFPFLLGFLLIALMFNYRYFAYPHFHREDWREFANYVQSQDAEIVFVANSQMEGMYYYNSQASLSYYPALKFDKAKILLMRYVVDIFDPEDKARKMVEERGYQKINEHDFNGIVVWEYANENSN